MKDTGVWTEEMHALLLERKDTLRLPWRSIAPIGPHNARRCQARYKWLKELEAQGQRAPARSSVKAAERALDADAGPADGIDWLLKKGRLTSRRHRAAQFYRKAFRDGGGLSIKSSLGNVDQAGGGTPGPGLHADGGAIAYTQAKRDLHHIQTQVLWSQDDLLTVCDAICGIGQTPRSLVGGDGHKAATVEAVLMVALDLIARWLDTSARTHG